MQAPEIARKLELGTKTIFKPVSASSAESVRKNADEWAITETAAQSHVVHTLDIFRAVYADTTANTNGAHGVATLRGEPIEILAVHGETHAANIAHGDKYVSLRRRKLIVVSRDAHNSPIPHRQRSFLVAKSSAASIKFNDLAHNKRYMSFQDVLTVLTNANNTEELEGGIHATLAD